MRHFTFPLLACALAASPASAFPAPKAVPVPMTEEQFHGRWEVISAPPATLQFTTLELRSDGRFLMTRAGEPGWTGRFWILKRHVLFSVEFSDAPVMYLYRIVSASPEKLVLSSHTAFELRR